MSDTHGWPTRRYGANADWREVVYVKSVRSAGELVVATLQWLVVSTLVSASILIVMASVLGLRGAVADGYVARGIAFVGLFSGIQLVLGHREAAYEGPSTFTLAALALVVGNLPLADRLPAFAVALAFSGATLAFLAVWPKTAFLAMRLDSGYMNGMFLVLLGMTVAVDSVPRAIARVNGPSGRPIVMLAVVVTTAIVAESSPAVRSLSVLLSVAAGLGVLVLYGGMHAVPAGRVDLVSPHVTKPIFSAYVIVPAVAAAVMIAGNSWFTEVAVARAASTKFESVGFRRGLLVTAAAHVAQGVLPGMATVPHGESSALVAKHPRHCRQALAIASALMLFVPFLPAVRRVTAWYPPSLGADVLLAICVSLVALGIRQLMLVGWYTRRIVALTGAVVLCLGLALAPKAWFPGALGVAAASPIVVGVLVALAGQSAPPRGQASERAHSLDDLPIDR